MISLPKRGALNVLSVEIERELTEEDLLQLSQMPDNSPPQVKTISARHRRMAMLVAEGKTNQQIAEALWYTPARVGQLRVDPGTSQLISYYEDQLHEESLGDEKRYQEKLRAAGEQALDLINDRLEDPVYRDRISTTELRNIVTVAADRTVAPPKQVQQTQVPPQQITLNFGTTLKPRDREALELPLLTITSDGDSDEDRDTVC